MGFASLLVGAAISCGTEGEVLRPIAADPSAPTSSAPTPGPCGTSANDAGGCKACDRDCQGGACVDGLCQPVVVSSGNAFTPGGALALGDAHLFWMRYTDGALLAAPLDGGDARVLAVGLEDVFSLGARGRDVYFGTWHTPGAVADRVGSTSVLAEPPTTLADGYGAITSVVVDDTAVYWAALIGQAGVHRRTFAGQTTALTTELPATQLALDGDWVYFTSSASGRIARVPRSGGPLSEIASGQAAPWGIAVSDSKVVWANDGAGTVVRASVGGGATEVLASGLDGPNCVALDGADVFITEKRGGGIFRWRAGSLVRLAQDPLKPQSLFVRDRRLYWVDEGGAVFRLAL
jgi:hypothetical protein